MLVDPHFNQQNAGIQFVVYFTMDIVLFGNWDKVRNRDYICFFTSKVIIAIY